MIKHIKIVLTAVLLLCQQAGFAQDKSGSIVRNMAANTITITTADKKITLLIDYSAGCFIRQLIINGKNTLSPLGIFSGVETDKDDFTSANNKTNVQVKQTVNAVTIKGISFGDAANGVNETWRFVLDRNNINWDIDRQYRNNSKLQDMAMPKWNFAGLSVWKGGIFDNGGMVWCKYLNKVNDTYGIHTGGVTFWNDTSGDGLAINASTDSDHTIASKYSHSENNEFTFTQLVSEKPLQQRYNLSRFINRRADVFAPFEVKKGSTTMHLVLQYVDYFAKYSRGNLTGIDAGAVRELMNTTGRYGVVDNNIVGANGWKTNWKCLHEPFFAQIGMALNDQNYTSNFSSTLNQERDEAMLPDGRVLSRWHDVLGDEIKGTYNAKTGYYEAMWGYTVDSQTSYIINASEQFDLNGDVNWLRLHQASCEKALDWLIKRDANDNGIFEMMNNNIAEKKASDWLDIVWASYENAFVNAQMFEALNLWANCEKVLGNTEKAKYYRNVAARLKTAFNKPITEGGFWSPEKRQYVYWRDNDGSIHGDNLVTPVNFAAIAFGLCDDKTRIAQVLDQIEKRTTAENLFHWPLCFDSFTQAEVSAGNWPFPKYENGDIFPTWGYLGVRAYAGYNKSIALKYITKILEQYKKDGLSSQRYSRNTQLGQGDDILAGICTTIAGLYRDIYGIRPKWNRMGLQPNLSASLNNTQFNYTLRGMVYSLRLRVNNYVMQTRDFSVSAKEGFGAAMSGGQLLYYHQNGDGVSLKVRAGGTKKIRLAVTSWTAESKSWQMQTPGTYRFTVSGSKPGSVHQLIINGRKEAVSTQPNGDLIVKKTFKIPSTIIVK